MGKWWMPDNGTAAVGIHDEDGKWLSDAAYRSHADAIIAAHNVDIDALTAERDELQRRLDAVVASLKPGECKDWLGGYWLQKHTLWTRAVAIAEGRNNG